ncbi:GNAT family N-acetyltransferase [Peribacillus alkalitolerans]|uniref:GNAT family N-acetyltransferase n=1 Tax=Peribacillus alkalitolerans TaxID=1550385 RepID=UPI0013D47212|nr:GNAT family N-acetyltransferase [Peribacillus alkalitolerans]
MQLVQNEVERIEKLELALTVFNSKRALSMPDKNLTIKRVGNCTSLMDTASPNSIYYNRIKGFGIADADKIDEILDTYYTKGINPCFDMIPTHIDLEVSKALAAKGYYCAEQLVFLGIEPYEYGHQADGIEIVNVSEENVVEFLNLISQSQEGIGFKEEIVKSKARYFIEPRFQNFIAYIGHEAIGMGSLFIEGDEGYIANDFTFPSHRGRGVQKALLHHRLQIAQKLGLRKVFTDVEFGTISHDNMVKLGFQTIYMNSFWMKQ